MSSSFYITNKYYSFSIIVFEVFGLSTILTKDNLVIFDNNYNLTSFDYTLKNNHPIYSIVPNNNFQTDHRICYFVKINTENSNINSVYYSLTTAIENSYSYSLLTCMIPKDIKSSNYYLSITSLNNTNISSNNILIPICSSIDFNKSQITVIESTHTESVVEFNLNTAEGDPIPSTSYPLKVLVD